MCVCVLSGGRVEMDGGNLGERCAGYGEIIPCCL